jgi:hypothetical protein
MRVNSEFVLNEIDESDLQHEKQYEQRIWTWRGIVIDVICASRSAPSPIRVTGSVVAGDGKKTDDGTMIALLEGDIWYNWVTIDDPPETEALTFATTKDFSDIGIMCKIYFWGPGQKLRGEFGWITLTYRSFMAAGCCRSSCGFLDWRDVFCDFRPSAASDCLVLSCPCWSAAKEWEDSGDCEWFDRGICWLPRSLNWMWFPCVVLNSLRMTFSDMLDS